ncbi:hypothetical protein EAO71_16250 [Streptomyces sp. ms191]|uniref:hypothetical protein n=1 Tax=unclassified Streptomyces TaxID=2593676 RepID=UPI0011CE08A7|nr:hypothetical protein [Streptomyces sp. ms191]TXS30095.1 hypothetical protein EAO71_16250 [Streptomyces sp. ms191]
MGKADQFRDKAQDLADQARAKMGNAKDEASSRASRAKDRSDEERRAQMEAQDRFDQDYDA